MALKNKQIDYKRVIVYASMMAGVFGFWYMIYRLLFS